MNNKTVDNNVISVKYTEAEFGLLRGTFKGKSQLLKTVRKSLLQQELNEEEKAMLFATFQGEGLRSILQKIFLPSLEDDVDVNWLSDKLDMIGGAQLPLQLRNPEGGAVAIKARLKSVAYCEQEFNNLFNRKDGGLILKSLESPAEDNELFINWVAREEIIEKIKNFLRELRIMSETDSLTPEEMKEIAKKNSSK